MAETLQDREIIRLLEARDETAVRELQHKYGRYCLTVAMNILHNAADAEECVNDVYLKTWNSIPPAHPTSLRLFLAKLTRNAALDRYRVRRKRGTDFEVALDELENVLAVPEEDADELPNLVNEFLDGLPSTERTTFLLRYWHAMPVADIARRGGWTVNAVSVRLYKTREKLRAFLAERGYHV